MPNRCENVRKGSKPAKSAHLIGVDTGTYGMRLQIIGYGYDDESIT
jgi:hypothetical protein